MSIDVTFLLLTKKKCKCPEEMAACYVPPLGRPASNVMYVYCSQGKKQTDLWCWSVDTFSELYWKSWEYGLQVLLIHWVGLLAFLYPFTSLAHWAVDKLANLGFICYFSIGCWFRVRLTLQNELLLGSDFSEIEFIHLA